MAKSHVESNPELLARVKKWVKNFEGTKINVFTDTTEFMNILRGDIICLKGHCFYVKGDLYEQRCGLSDPKFWVKKCIDLQSGELKILKLTFYENFITNVGLLSVNRYRKPAKEAAVLELVRNDTRFMQGMTLKDQNDNLVRVIDFIPGVSLFNYLTDLQMPHEDYFFQTFPDLLKKFVRSLEGIAKLHNANLCHGDPRNDHLIIDRDTGDFKWIDFDYDQSYCDFDLWGLGNILNFITAKGIQTLREIKNNKQTEHLAHQIKEGDMSAFFPYRIMNLHKLYPYIPRELRYILSHFSVNSPIFYDNVQDFISDLREVIRVLSPSHQKKGALTSQKFPRKRILLVDDNPDFLHITKSLLTKSIKNGDIATATSSNQALKLIHKKKYNLVICDIMMPDIGGLELLSIIKKIKPQVRVIMMSAHSSMIAAQRSLQRGADFYLEKPIHPPLLLSKIDEVIAKKPSLALNQSS